jgi:6-phosphofructokinase 1
VAQLYHLCARFRSEAPSGFVNMLRDEKRTNKSFPSIFNRGFSPPMIRSIIEYNRYINESECVVYDVIMNPSEHVELQAFPRAGPRKQLHFDPRSVNAAIVNCSGICPGLNSVVRSLTISLFHEYCIQGKIWGVQGGFKGFYDEKYKPIELTLDTVKNIHHTGGTIIKSSRGGKFEMDKIINFIRREDIKQIYGKSAPYTII